MKLPTLIFDLGGVLINIQYRRFLKTLGLDYAIEGEPQKILGESLNVQDEAELLRLPTLDLQLYETGKLSTSEFFNRLSHRLDGSFDEALLHAAWHAVLAGEIDGMRAIAEHLSRQTKLFLLSNTNELHFTYARKKFSILKFFTDYFVSYQIGVMKPSVQIYQHAVRSIGIKASELLFIDDIEQNIRGGEQVGMRGYLFTGIAPLRSKLQEEGFHIM